jgi:nitrate reductase gamma subunit
MSGTPSTVNLSDNRGPYIHAAVGTCLALAVIGVVARLVCRRIMKTALNASDYFVIAGLVAAIVEGSLIFAGKYIITVLTAIYEWIGLRKNFQE